MFIRALVYEQLPSFISLLRTTIFRHFTVSIKIIFCWLFLFDIFRYSCATRRFVSFEKSLFQTLQSLPFVALSFIFYYCFRSWYIYTHTLKLLQLRLQCITFTLFLLIFWSIYWSLHTSMLQFSLPLSGSRPIFSSIQNL